MLKLIPASALKQRPQVKSEGQEETPTLGSYAFASTFFQLEVPPLAQQSDLALPLTAAFHDATALTIAVAKGLSNFSSDMSGVRSSLIDSLTLLNAIVERVQQTRGSLSSISWNPQMWLSTILDCVQAKVCSKNASL